MLDAFIKTMRIRPSVIQGSEPYYLPWGFILSALTMLAAKLLDVPYYFPMFENVPPEIKFNIRKAGIPAGWFLIPFLKNFATHYAKGASLIFALNESAKQNLLNLGVSKSKIVKRLYGTWGVDTRKFCHARNGTEPDFGDNAILFVGRIVPAKGIRYLLEAFLKVRKIIPTTRLIFIGDGSMIPEIKKFILENSLQSTVSFLGVINNRGLPPYIRASRIVAAPSLTTPTWMEQVGMVNIQSISCGTPVVTTNSGSIPEFIEDGVTGIIVPERNSAALVRAIIRLLTDSELYQRLSRNGRQAAEQKYDATRNIAEVEQIILSRVLHQTM
ncbi:hypothetical protein CH330_08725 [candidate division WOR-3 bacterium JGI_Cruoil_03_51_56]|uniref:Glycosyl transferase family 1 domain-containing protein n=1 Tax=candidate division WOR-3 bacterium JGI_Cruoil_03_51_56 TaxID=1973747 RepID=A0A235BQ41_UNCW3|nr:MAG: hypothetical protein CH330_08725 [candidate division WOR-3 bacterium JGI_Cruoil_03_51_56]